MHSRDNCVVYEHLILMCITILLEKKLYFFYNKFREMGPKESPFGKNFRKKVEIIWQFFNDSSFKVRFFPIRQNISPV